MKQRGRKSAQAALVRELPSSRPQAPTDLTEYQQGVWTTVVATKPADWFTADTHELLKAYCKHVSSAAVLDQQIDEFKPEWLLDDDGLRRYQRLLTMRDQQSKQIVSLSRQMRLTQQSRYEPKVAATHSRPTEGRKPWEM